MEKTVTTGRVVIRTKDGPATSGTAVEIDGVRIPNVRTVRFEHVAGDLPVVLVEIMPRAGIAIEGMVDWEGRAVCMGCSERFEATRRLIPPEIRASLTTASGDNPE